MREGQYQKAMDRSMHMLSSKQKISSIEAHAVDYVPTRILEIEIGQPLPPLTAIDEKKGQHYQRALCLIRLHTQPLGVVELQLAENGVSTDEYAQQIWYTLHNEINEHLRQDGLPLVAKLDATGLPCTSTPTCIEERERFYVHAPFVSIIVSTHDRPERIPTCLGSLLTLHYPRYEIIIVDNAPSTTATADFIQQTYRDVPQVRYIREDRIGLPWARNYGIMAAKGEILAFTDDDVVIDPYWLIELIRGFSLVDDVACVTGLILPLELETSAQAWLEEYGGFGKGFTQRVFDIRENRLESPLYPYIAGRFGTGGNMAFKAAFLRNVDGFDPTLTWSEDIAMFFQVIMRGYKLVYKPASLLYHCHHRDYVRLQKQIYNYGIGLSSYLISIVLNNPRLLLDLVMKFPYGLYFILGLRSPKNRKKSRQYPKELTRLELKGMLYGPYSYLQSLWTMRHIPRGLTSFEGNTLLPTRLEEKKKGMDTWMLSMEQELSSMAQTMDFASVRILEVEIGKPLPQVSAKDERTGQLYWRAMCLVRLHTQPLGEVELHLDINGVSADDYALHIWHSLSTQINDHLQRDGLPPVTRLGAEGLGSSSIPRCLEEREQFLANAPFVSVIVPTHDRPDQVERCLRSLLVVDYPRYEIIIVDNAPTTSATAALVQRMAQDVPYVRYVREDRPGPASARNCGIVAAKGKILAFTDDDVVVDPYWLIELVRAFNVADDVVCVTGLVFPLELETPSQVWFEEYGGFNKGFTRRFFDMKEHHPRTPLYPYAAGIFGTGASMAFTQTFLYQVNGFDLTLAGNSQAPGGEDVDLFLQAVMRGHKLVYEPASLVYHQHRRDYAVLRKQVYHYGEGLPANIMKYVQEHPRLLFDIVAKLPYGIFFALSGRSSKNRKKSATYPKELTRLELKGMLYGPYSYLRSWWVMRHVPKTLIPANASISVPDEKGS